MHKILKWFNTYEAKTFGQNLADFYIARVNKNHHQSRDKAIERKQRELLIKLSQQIELFKSQHPMNFYQKAQTGNVFKWRLLDAGLNSAHVDELTSWITRQL